MSAALPHVVVVGAGLAGLSTALDLADAGCRVTVVERRRRLGGLTWSYERHGRTIDNGQHVFLRCCNAYRGWLDRIGSDGDVVLQDRLDITVRRPAGAAGGDRRRGGGPVSARLRRSALPAPAHLALALARYGHLGLADRLRLGLAAIPLRRVDVGDPALDGETFAAWLGRHGQSPAAISALWDLITVPTVNLPAAEASAAAGAKVMQTGLLRHAGAADIGWAAIPLGALHGERAAKALADAGVEVHTGTRTTAVAPVTPGDGVRVSGEDGVVEADAVVVAVPHTDVADILPAGAGLGPVERLGLSAIVDVHLTFDRPVSDVGLLAGLDSTAEWVFDRTASSGLARSAPGQQYLAVSLSAADRHLGTPNDELVAQVTADLAQLLPAVAGARLVDSFVTKERTATFRAAPGSAALRPGPRTAIPGVYLAGAWTDTGWPATMEGAVRSGRSAARAALVDAGVTRSLPQEVA